MKLETTIGLAVLFVVTCVLVLSGITMITTDVIGANITNASSISKVYVWNTEPNITSVVVSPSVIDLTPGNTTEVTCTAFVFDYNGWQDVNVSNATFYHESTSSSDPDDNNNHYSNSSCSCEQDGANVNNATCACTFQVQYYADVGNWICNISVIDSGGNATERIHNFNSSGNASATINAIIGIDVPEEIDYGNLSVTEQSGVIPANVSNIGNVPINVSVRGFGGDNDTTPDVGNLAMMCDLGNITNTQQRYAIDSAPTFADMTNLTNISTLINGFLLSTRSNDTAPGNDTNTTYWLLQVPLSVGGFCNGTIEFSATET